MRHVASCKYLLAGILFILAGCKLEVVAVQGGDLKYSGGTCFEGSNCVISISDPDFSETITAVPKPGYQFVKWREGDGFNCGGSTNPVCTVTLPATFSAEQKAAVVAVWDYTSSVMPIYVGDLDTDLDRLGDRTDADDDNDGVLDESDRCPLEAPNDDGFGCPFPADDQDGDGVIDDQDWVVNSQDVGSAPRCGDPGYAEIGDVIWPAGQSPFFLPEPVVCRPGANDSDISSCAVSRLSSPQCPVNPDPGT